MKKRVLFFVLCVLFAISANAQEDYSIYLNKAMKKIEAGDCEGAKRFYNVYKELTESTASWLDKAIKDCQEQTNLKTYNIGEDAKDLIGRSGYKIAYLDASGKHGFAIQYYESGDVQVTDASIEDLKLMYRNRYSLGLSGEYWSNTVVEGTGKGWSQPKYYTFNFSTGIKNERRNVGNGEYINLWVERF